jgi:hypothetical protein
MIDFEISSVSIFRGDSKLLGMVSLAMLVDGETVGWVNRISIFAKTDCPGEYHASITQPANRTQFIFPKETFARMREVAVGGYIRAISGQSKED